MHRIKRSTDGNLDNQQLKQVQEVRVASLQPLLARSYCTMPSLSHSTMYSLKNR